MRFTINQLRRAGANIKPLISFGDRWLLLVALFEWAQKERDHE